MIAKTYLPKSLFGRALLILVVPTLLTQLLLAYVFYDRHWKNVTRYLSHGMAGEIAFLIDLLEEEPVDEQAAIMTDFQIHTGMRLFFDTKESFSQVHNSDEFEEFQLMLGMKIDEPFTVRRVHNDEDIEVRILHGAEVLRIETSVKRLESRTTVIYILWMIGVSTFLLLIAVVFLRNQIRPIRALAEAADNFGRGVDMPGFRPRGAQEVRKASLAFIVMRERLKRQIRTRTDMLAGISHDLRTPLTRMKLQLALLKDEAAVAELHEDVQQMEHMIAEYLDFARGEGSEEAIRINLKELLKDMVADYARQQSPVEMVDAPDMELDIRVTAFRRMMQNIIDNALRYGKAAHIKLQQVGSYYEVVVDDEGEGIASDKYEEVFKPFSRLDPSRNSNKSGAGLGLTIARDIARAHGGGIVLDRAPSGGLRVIVKLPIQK